MPVFNSPEYLSIGLTEYQQSVILNDTEIDISSPNNTTNEMDRIVLMLYNNTNSAKFLTWLNTVLWVDNISPLYIGNTNSTKEMIKVELWKNINDTWSGSYIRYTEADVVVPSVGSPYTESSPSLSGALINVFPSTEYQRHTITQSSTIDLAAPNATIGELDRIIFALDNTTTTTHSIAWSGTNIQWDNDDIPLSIGTAQNPNEHLIFEFWEDSSTNNSWLGSYKLYADNAPIVAPPILSIPYDIAFSVSGTLQQNVIVGSFAITRNIDIVANAPGSIIYTESPTSNGSYTLSINVKSNNGTVTNNIGNIVFSLGQRTGVLTITNPITLVSGDIIQVNTDPVAAIDPGLQDISITIVGCSTTVQC